MLCLSGTLAFAQGAPQPKYEVFGGYSWLHPNGYVDWGKVPDIVDGFNASITHYLPNAHNLGIVVDGGYHWTGSTSFTSQVGLALGGLQYKWHTDQFSPFVRVLAGAAHLTPNYLAEQWKPAVGGGGGFDLTLTPKFNIRVAQVDYIWTYYRHPSGFSTRSTNWNMIRLAAGLEYNIGNYVTAPPASACTATPSTVLAGEPVKVTATGSNFNPKHTLNYSWALNGGKISPTNAQTATIDTTGLSEGTHTANATITDPKGPKNANVANCGANFNVNVPHNPPQVTCSANPTSINSGESSTITANATSPDNSPISSYAYTSTAGTISGSGTSATLNTTPDLAGQNISVTVTATDARGLTGSCTTQVGVIKQIACVNVEDWGECTFEKNPKKPWRVDNDCKDTLDKLALRLQQMPNGKLEVVGFTDEKESVNVQQLGSQRSVNVKYYLVTEGPTKSDPSRIEPRQGGTKGKATHFYFVPEGGLCQGQVVEGTPVDENVVKGQARNAHPSKKKAHKAKPAAPPAQ
jgi:hypothetical protein